MQKHIILVGAEFFGETELKSGKHSIKFLDRESQKMVKVMCETVNIDDFDKPYLLRDVSMINDDYDVITFNCKSIENINFK